MWCMSVCVKVDSCVWVCLCTSLCMYLYVSALPLCVFACMCSWLPSRWVWLVLHVCTCACMCVCENETDIKRERLWGQAREQLHSEEEFCSADDYTCRADATPAAGALTAKVTEPGWHREGPRGTGRVCERVCVSLCEVMLDAGRGWVQSEAAVW